MIGGYDCTGDPTSWTADDFDRLAQMFKAAAQYLRSGSHVNLNCDGVDDRSFCFIAIEQPYGGEPYVYEFMSPGALDMKKLVRERNRRFKRGNPGSL